jgi:hypothetical protein
MASPVVEDYRFGRIVVDGQTHTRDLILLPDRVMGDWWRKEGHRLAPEDLEVVIDAGPEVLVIGTGASGLMKVPPMTMQALEEAGIELRVSTTAEACRIYNDLRNDRHVAGAFHLTC